MVATVARVALRPFAPMLFLAASALLSPLHAEDKPQAAVQPAGSAASVRIDNFSFTPPEITVAPDTTLTWTNADDIPHTVVAINKAFRSKAMDTDQTYSFTFKEPGTYDYFCSLHPHMKGKVIVK
jgi:amicyanin